MKKLTSAVFSLFTHLYTTKASGALAGHDNSLQKVVATLKIKDLRLVA